MTSQPPEPPAPWPPSPEEGNEWPGYARDGYGPDDYPAMPDYPPTPDYPATPGHPPTPDYPATLGNPPAQGYLANPPARGYLDPQADRRAGIPGTLVTHEEYVHPGGPPAAGADVFRAAAGSAPGRAAESAQATGSEGTRWAMLGYLMVPFFGFLVPLAIYLTSRRGSPWLRAHAAQAINVWLTGILYDLSAAIVGAMLVLDSPHVALTVVLPLVATLWLTTLAFLMHAATVASRGGTYAFPRWLCAPIVH
ncbi:MAG TPA: DUF4870 domain-containing protein [Streptosporangiaceae bacterium]|nr:DUF4870 domain-containing protein [Streptosporangiaceae bacterium]